MYEAVWAEVAPKIAAELNCPVQNILMSVTHSHSAGSPMGPARDDAYTQRWATRCSARCVTRRRGWSRRA